MTRAVRRVGVVRVGALTSHEIGSTAAAFGSLNVDPVVAGRLDPELARRYTAIAVGLEGDVLRVAVPSDADTAVLDAIAFAATDRVEFVAAPAEEIHAAIDRVYPAPTGASQESAPIVVAASETEPVLVQLVESLLENAIRRRASDIHLEPNAKQFRVRLRIDGVLVDVEAPPRHLQLPVISRLKIMAGISIAEKRVPQDGRLSIGVAGGRVDFRAASLPTVHGESMVLRILESDPALVDVGRLGLLGDQLRLFETALGAPDGMLLVTGPTGCGKSTTLYGCLQRLNEAQRKVITVEDPVERQLRGITQVSVRAYLGLSFAAALRAMLRQAPNVIMVGEIRDRETAEVALNAALTGHLVLSTLHTNDAPSAITRLIDLGARPFLVAAALRGVVAQRLVRSVCSCRRTPAGRGAGGCAGCHGSGFQGRIGIFEMFLMSEQLRALVHARATASALRSQTRREGMLSLREDGIRKVLAGHTTIDEVLSATSGDADQPQPTLTP